jgi:hypothetical protein
MLTINNVIRNIVNIPGWSTRRRIVVFESDDWGSIRMPSKAAKTSLTQQGFSFAGQSFNQLDSLEANDDLSSLFDVLTKHTDATNRHPVFTAVSVVANPDFEKIEASGFQQYYYEPFTETLNRYPQHNEVLSLYKQGMEQRLFYPVFHGREHLNVQRWMRALQAGNASVLTTFRHRITGVHLGINNEFLGDFQAAFDVDTLADLKYHAEVLEEGLALFETIWKYKSPYFVIPNGSFHNSLEKKLADGGVKYLLGERYQKEPQGNDKFKRHFHYLGMKNKHHQVYLTRNAFFEPAIIQNDWSNQPIEKCMKSIERAFRWGKPAIVSTHRINYIGSIEEKNRTKNVDLLDKLLTSIVKRWPDVEFMTSIELGDLIAKEK